MHNKKGFTLIELLIVIVVIAILASLVIGVAGIVQSTARIDKTKAVIATLSSACSSYHVDWRRYPDIGASGTASLSATESANRELMKLLESFYVVDEVERGGYLTGDLAKNPAADTYVDAWDLPIRVWRGRNHSTENPPGPNNDGGTKPYSQPLDIFSAGPDEQMSNSFISTGVWVSTVSEDEDNIMSWR